MPLPKTLTTVTPFSKALAIVLFFLFPIFGFALGMEYQKAMDMQNVPTSTITTTIKPLPTPTISQTQWQTFTNTKYGYTINYPSNYTICSAKNTDDFFLFTINTCGTSENPTQMYIKPVSSFTPPTDKSCVNIKKEPIIVDGITTIKYFQTIPSDVSKCPPFIGYSNKLAYIPVSHNNQQFEIFINNQNNADIKSQILSTLKFTDSVATPSKNCRTETVLCMKAPCPTRVVCSK